MFSYFCNLTPFFGETLTFWENRKLWKDLGLRHKGLNWFQMGLHEIKLTKKQAHIIEKENKHSLKKRFNSDLSSFWFQIPFHKPNFGSSKCLLLLRQTLFSDLHMQDIWNSPYFCVAGAGGAHPQERRMGRGREEQTLCKLHSSGEQRR